MRQACSFFLLILLLGACSTATPTPTPTPAPPRRTATPWPTLPTPTKRPILYRAGCVIAGRMVRLRAGPGTEFEIIGGLPPGACFFAFGISEDAGWVLLSFEGQQGWTPVEHLSIEGGPAVLVVMSADETPPAFETQNVFSVPIETLIPSITPTRTPSPFLSRTPSPIGTLTVSPSSTPGPAFTRTPTRTATASASPTLSGLLCSDTLAYAGQLVTCTIPRAYCSYQSSEVASPTICSDVPLPNYNFLLVIWGGNLSSFDGDCLIVYGTVSTFAGWPQIVTTSPTQVSVCPRP